MGKNATPKLVWILAPLWFFLLTPASSVAVEPTAETHHSTPASSDQELTLEGFLDRLMLAESGGNDLARNPKSTALGAFQFISSTFLRVVRRHFASETATLSYAEILRLRTDSDFARRAAAAYTKDNAIHLASHGVPTSFPNLRLAYLVGPSGAVKVLQSKPDVKVATVLSAKAVRANPFMARMSVADLVAKAARDLSVAPDTQAGIVAEIVNKPNKARPRVVVRCNLARPSCQRWLRLAEARLARKDLRGASNQ